MAGKTVGVTTMYMDETMDTGDIILQRAIDLTGDEDYGETMLRLSDIGRICSSKPWNRLNGCKSPYSPGSLPGDICTAFDSRG